MQVGRSLGVLAVLVMLTVCAALAVGVGGVVATDHDETLLIQDIDADSVVLDADIDADGNAEWRVIYRQELDDEADREAFADLETDIEEDTESYLNPFIDRMERTVASASNATNREMNADSFAVTTERRSQPDTELGEVVFSFRWNGFAAVEDGGDRILAGDAIDRLVLDADRSLQLRWPDAYGLTDVTPDADTVDDQRVVWRGEREFDDGQPRIVVATDDGEPVDGDVGDGMSADGEGTTVGDDSTLPLLAALLIAALILAGAAMLWRRQQDDDGKTAAAAGGTKSGDDGSTAAGGEAEGPPPELLSNEEQVLRLLEQNGGRMKQQAVAEQLDWTDAKTSQVVGDLRDDEEVESFRLGRENVLTLPEVDIDGSTDDDGSQHEE